MLVRKLQTAGVGKVARAAQVSGYNVSTVNIAWAAKPGRLAIFYGWTRDGGQTVPEGFAKIAGASGSNDSVVSAYRVCDGTEGIVSVPYGAGGNCKFTFVFFDIPGYSIATPYDSYAVCTDATPASTTVNMAGYTAPLVAFAGLFSNGSYSIVPSLSNWTTALDQNSRKIYYRIYQRGELPANATVGMNDAGYGNAIISGFLKLGY